MKKTSILLALILIPSLAFANTKSADFETASTQYLSITDGAQTGLDLSTNVSYSFWIKFESVGDPVNIISKWVTSGDQRSFNISTAVSENTLKLIGSSNGTAGGTTVASVAWTPSTATWYHVALVKSGSNLDFYVDGVQVGTTQTTVASFFNSTASFMIGTRSDLEGYADGLIDEVRVWSRALTATEVEDLYSGVCTLTGDTNLVSYWDFENDFVDSENANNLTNNNTVTFNADVPYSDCVTGGGGGGIGASTMATSTDILYKDWIFVNSIIIFLLSLIGMGLLFSPAKERMNKW